MECLLCRLYHRPPKVDEAAGGLASPVFHPPRRWGPRRKSVVSLSPRERQRPCYTAEGVGVG